MELTEKDKTRLAVLIERVKSLLNEENVDFADYDGAVELLNKTVCPLLNVGLYEQYIR